MDIAEVAISVLRWDFNIRESTVLGGWSAPAASAPAQRRDHQARLDPPVAHSADHRNRPRQRRGMSQHTPRDRLRPESTGNFRA